MAVGGTNRTVYSEETMKKSSVQSVLKAMTNANNEALKTYPKDAKKAK